MKDNKAQKGIKSKLTLSRVSVALYWLIFILLSVMFFTNDFGLVDIHKTSIITAVAIDSEDGEVLVTAEVAVPQPSQSGENIKYTQIQGSGLTVSDAMNEVNSKTGFYPKLQFCKLIIIGESCKDVELFRILGCFYRKNYSELTALVTMCQGKAADMLSLKSPVADMTSEAILNILSGEVEKSAIVTGANLKKIAAMQYSESAACYMPYLEANKPGTSESGGNGDNVGGEGGNQGSQGGGSGGSGGESGGESGQQSQSGGSGGGEEEVEFTARRTAYFNEGKFAGILDEQQSFALAVYQNEIRLAVLPCDADGKHYTVGLKGVDCGADIDVKDGVPEITFNFKAQAQIQGVRAEIDLQKIISDDKVPKPVLEGAESQIRERFENLVSAVKESNSDILGVRQLLYKYRTKYYQAFKDDILQRMKVNYKIEIQSVT